MRAVGYSIEFVGYSKIKNFNIFEDLLCNDLIDELYPIRIYGFRLKYP